MTAILCFDTETSNKADFNAPPNAPHQPHLLELGWIFSPAGTPDGPASRGHIYVDWPGQVPIYPEAIRVHGLTPTFLDDAGVGPRTCFALMTQMIEKADRIIAYNIDFDLLVLRAMAARLDRLDQLNDLIGGRDQHCVMRSATAHCALPGIRGQYKWPKLEEAHTHFFGAPHTGAHGALADVEATWRIYWAIRAREKAITPAE